MRGLRWPGLLRHPASILSSLGCAAKLIGVTCSQQTTAASSTTGNWSVAVCKDVQRSKAHACNSYAHVVAHNSAIPCRGTERCYRWIFTIDGGRWKAYPKIGYVDTASEFDAVSARVGPARACWSRYAELSFWWEGTLELSIVNDNFLGPSADAVKGYYNALLDDDCDAALQVCTIKQNS